MNPRVKQLDVAIPTFNRPKELTSLVNSFLHQTRDAHLQGFRISLIIADNGGSLTPELEAVLAREDGIEVELIRQKENIGYDANVASLLAHCLGDYVLLVSDDDLFGEDALGEILRLLRESPSSLHIFENRVYGQSTVSADGQFFDRVSEKSGVKSLYLRDMRWENFEIYGGLTGLCFPTSLLVNFPSKSFIGSNWIQLGLLLWLAEQGYEIAVNRGNFFLYRLGNKESRWGRLGVHLGIWSIYASMSSRLYPFAKFARRKYFRMLVGAGLRTDRGAFDFVDSIMILRARANDIGVWRCLVAGSTIAILWCLPTLTWGRKA